MMFRKRIPPGHGQWAVPVIMLLLLLGIVAGALIVGSALQPRVHLDDGTVWVTSLKDRRAARFNVRIREADADVPSSSVRFDIVQHDGDTVILEDTEARYIKASTVNEDGTTAMATDVQTLIGANTIAFINTKTGNVWTGVPSNLGSVNLAASPKMRLGEGGRIVVAHDGTIYGYR